MNELSTELQQGVQTAIEKALQMDENGMVSAKHLYDFLGLSGGNYSRWIQRNLLRNASLSEGIDFKAAPTVVLPSDERMNTGVQPNPTKDYMISIEVAKYLAMDSHTERGREVKDYFSQTEHALVRVALKLPQMQQQQQMLMQRVEQLGALVTQYQSQIEDHNTRLALIDGGSKMVTTYQQKWVQETFEDVKKLAAVYTSGDWKACISALIDNSQKYLDDSYNEYARAYRLKYPQEIHPYRLAVIAEFDEFREAFENALLEQMRHFGLINPPKENPLNAFYASMNVEEV